MCYEWILREITDQNWTAIYNKLLEKKCFISIFTLHMIWPFVYCPRLLERIFKGKKNVQAFFHWQENQKVFRHLLPQAAYWHNSLSKIIRNSSKQLSTELNKNFRFSLPVFKKVHADKITSNDFIPPHHHLCRIMPLIKTLWKIPRTPDLSVT